MINNPKLDGSGILDCIPQTGKCPNDCPECFYNQGFYLDIKKDLPKIPTPEEAEGRIIRMNSGNDSANQKDLVIRTASQYKDAFFNTSISGVEFPGPYVLTLNPGEKTDQSIWCVHDSKIMFVRFRTNLWNLDLLEEACRFYRDEPFPVVMTFMRYKNRISIKQNLLFTTYNGNVHRYEPHKHLLNDYWLLNQESCYLVYERISSRFKNVAMCGTRHSSLCRDCGVCLREYYRTKERMRT